MNKSTVLGILTFWNDKDPDPYQREKQDPDPCENGLDPQHWLFASIKDGPKIHFKNFLQFEINLQPTKFCCE